MNKPKLYVASIFMLLPILTGCNTDNKTPSMSTTIENSTKYSAFLKENSIFYIPVDYQKNIEDKVISQFVLIMEEDPNTSKNLGVRLFSGNDEIKNIKFINSSFEMLQFITPQSFTCINIDKVMLEYKQFQITVVVDYQISSYSNFALQPSLFSNENTSFNFMDSNIYNPKYESVLGENSLVINLDNYYLKTLSSFSINSISSLVPYITINKTDKIKFENVGKYYELNPTNLTAFNFFKNSEINFFSHIEEINFDEDMLLNNGNYTKLLIINYDIDENILNNYTFVAPIKLSVTINGDNYDYYLHLSNSRI